MSHEYEVTVVTRVEESEADRRKLLDDIKKLIEAEKGKIVGTEDWGKRNLAYDIKKNPQGHYSAITFEGLPNTPQILSSKLRLMDELLRYLIVTKEGAKVEKKGKTKTESS